MYILQHFKLIFKIIKIAINTIETRFIYFYFYKQTNKCQYIFWKYVETFGLYNQFFFFLRLYKYKSLLKVI